MRQNRRGNTHPGFVIVIMTIMVGLLALSWFCRYHGTTVVLQTILPIAGVIVVCILFLVAASSIFAARRERMLARDYGIHLLDEPPEEFKEISTDTLEYNVLFWVKEVGDLKVAVFSRCWSTGFGSGRREHSAPAFVANLSGVTEITKDDVISLLGSDENLRAEMQGDLLVIKTDNSHSSAFKPETILVSVCELYKERAGNAESDPGSAGGQ